MWCPVISMGNVRNESHRGKRRGAGIPSTARYIRDGTRVGQWGCDCRAQTETTPTVVVPALALSFYLINDYFCGALRRRAGRTHQVCMRLSPQNATLGVDGRERRERLAWA